MGAGLRGGIAAVLVCASGGCFAGYDSRWGQSAEVQRQHAAEHAPALRGERADRAAGAKVREMRVRAFVARQYTTQVLNVPATLRELFDDVNDVLEPSLGARLSLEGIRTWDIGSDDDLQKLLAELRAADPAAEVDWVAGFVGALPRVSSSFHDLGLGDLPGRHVVLRAPSSAADHDSVEKAYGDLKDDERRKVQRDHRRHRVAAVFLHELGHTLGAPHERSERTLMYPKYRSKMTTFGPETTEIMRAVLARREAKSPAEQALLLRAIATGLQRAPAGIFFDEERDELVPQLEARASRLEGAGRATATAVESGAPAAPVAAAPPEELSEEDRARFVRACEAAAKNDFVGAWETAKPLFVAYPDALAVQDLRCTVATQVFSFAAARKECERLMSLSTGGR